MKLKYILKGLVKSIPGIEKVYNLNKPPGGTNNARYCYSVWLRHLTLAFKNGQELIPNRIAELGPGDSLGVGLSALLSGIEHYYAFDLIKYSNTTINLEIFDELVDLFQKRAPIPDNIEFPDIKPVLDNYDFPKNILTDEHLQKSMRKDRLERIRNSIKALDSNDLSGSMINYQFNWAESIEIKNESLDMILSQAVLEHVDDLILVYKTMYKWLIPNGIISHDIDFKSHGSADSWYGHWTYSDLEWKIVKGRKKYLINREPYSTHIRLLKENNFKVICDLKTNTILEIDKSKLSKRFKYLTDEDLTTQTVFIQAKKSNNLS